MSARRGISVTPTPAATSAWEAIVSSASKATRGSNPAWRHTSSVMRRQPLATVDAIQGSSARSLSESLRRFGERMVGGEDHVVGVLHQRRELEVRGERARHRVVVVDEREVDLSGAQQRAGLVGLGLDHAQLHLRVATVEDGHGLRHERGAGTLEAGEAQPAAAQPGDRGQLLLGGVQAAEDRLGVLHERAAGVREADAARAALHEPGAGLALEGGHVLADRRLGEAERLRGRGERALCGDLAKDLHSAHVEH